MVVHLPTLRLPMTSNRFIVATTCWNAGHLIIDFLRHYETIGAEAILVMDFGSEDHTLDVLNSSEWSNLVVPIPFPGLAAIDSSKILLEFAKEKFPTHWCLFCDPDEFLTSTSFTDGSESF